MSLASSDLGSARAIIESLSDAGSVDAAGLLNSLTREHVRIDTRVWSKAELLPVLDLHYSDNPNYGWLRKLLTKKPVRSLSGITSLTVLTKPFPCPGRCVFCPVDVRMPKSYIASEPGAQRAGRLGFDPYEQAFERLRAYKELGHPISKIELIVLGGSWSAYPKEYKRWFVKRLFDALNDFGTSRDIEDVSSYVTDWDDRINEGETYNGHINKSKYVKAAYEESATQEELEEAHRINESAESRCVGLSLETRPDLLDEAECISLRSLGATKIQIGIQSLDDEILKMNKRGHKVVATERAISLLRRFGFKVQVHWMPNLYGATPAKDIVDYDRVFNNLSIKPDELKAYPTALIENTELEKIADAGKWHAYEPEELNDVLAHVLTTTPEYCRLSRVIRDIPSFEILAGNKRGNLRQMVESTIETPAMHDIRAREVKDATMLAGELEMEDLVYETSVSTEHFLQFVRPSDRKLAGFLRLSLPRDNEHPLAELGGAAIIREVHVYGQSIEVGEHEGASQHQGFGRQLIECAADLATEAGFNDLAVISAIGTRKYYEKQGFSQQALYQHRSL